MRILSLFVVIAVACGFGYAGILYAQTFEIPNPFSIVISPQVPDAGEEFLVEATTPTVDERALRFEWTINGVVRPDLSGIGKIKIRITAGTVGSTTRVGVRALKSSALFAEASRMIPVANLSLDWTADTYVPPWYRGKALPVPGSIATIIATPEVILDGHRIAPENLLYRWTLDDQEFTNGVGERTLAIQTKPYTADSYRIEVVVEDISKRIRKEKKIFIITANPTGAIYYVSPLGGIEPRRALSLFSPSRSSVFDFQFEPFFFRIKSRSELSYRWSLGPYAITGAPQNPYFVTINTERREPGALPVAISVDDSTIITPSVEKQFTLTIP